MSTKTSFKRIALVAAVATTFGVLSGVAANAAQSLATTTTGATQSGSNSAGYTASPTVGTYPQITVTGAADHTINVSTSGVGTIYYPGANPSGSILSTTSGSTSALWYAGTTTPGAATFTSATAGTLTFSVYSAVAGTQTVTLLGDVGGTTTYTLTWGAAAVASAANSLVVLTNHSHTYAGTIESTTASADSSATDAATAPASTTGHGTASAAIYVAVNDNTTSPGVRFASDKVRARIVSGPGTLKIASAPWTTDAATTLTALVTAADGSLATVSVGGDVTTSANPFALVYVFANGTAGTTSVEISDATTGIVLGTKSVTFYGTTPAKIAVTQNYKVATANTELGAATTTAGSGSVTIAATDANGNPVAGILNTAGSSSSAGWYITSSNTACISTTLGTINVSAAGAAATDDPAGSYELDVKGAAGAASGCTSTVVFNLYVSSTLTLSTAPLTFAVGGTSIASVALTTDAASYVPGQKVTLTLTAKDSSGNAVADGSYGVWGNTSTTTALTPITASAQLTSNPFAIAASTANSYAIVGGVATATFYAPYTDGDVSLTSTLGATNSGLAAALQGTTLAATFAVSTGASTASQAAVDAANEATDAANAATDAANNAMDSADAAQQAALDAGDKADAALAAVTDLATKVSAIASQIASLSALVKKIAAKVKA